MSDTEFLHVPDFDRLSRASYSLGAPLVGNVLQIDNLDEDTFDGTTELIVERRGADLIIMQRSDQLPIQIEVHDQEGWSSLRRPDLPTRLFGAPIGELALQRVEGSQFWAPIGDPIQIVAPCGLERFSQQVAAFAAVKELGI